MRNDVMAALRSALSQASLLWPGAALLAAVSGGADSVALLCGLAELRGESGFHLYAVHVEHGLRGASSLADAAFVEALCQSLGVPLHSYHAGLAGDMNSPGAEARARETRQRLFAEAMEACHADALLTAHHQEDQAETVLMRLLRGAGAGGLGGMRASAPFGQGLLLRPFLNLPRHALTQALSEAGQPWQEDESNAEPCCLRNELRLDVFPRLRDLQPQVAQHMAQTALRLQWDEDCLSAMAQRVLDVARCRWPSTDALRRDALLEAPKAIALRAVRAWVKQGAERMDGTGRERALSHGHTLALYDLAALRGHGFLNLPGQLRVMGTAGYLHLRRQDGSPLWPMEAPSPAPIAPCPSRYTMTGVSFTLAPLAPGEPLPDGDRAVLLTDALLAQGLVLRLPKPGDRVHPFGASGKKALNRYLMDRKVDEPFRAAWPVLASGQAIHWVAGIGASEDTRLPQAACAGLWKLSVEGENLYPMLDDFQKKAKECSP